MHILNKRHITLEQKNRLYNSPLPIIGLTGSIATGKSSVSKIFKDNDFFVIDADELVHEIYAQSDTINFISKISPQSVEEDKINFKNLRDHFFGSSNIRSSVETFIYNRLPAKFTEKIEGFDKSKNDFIFYDVPLLFEKNLEDLVDKTLTIFTSEKLQLERLIKRDNIDIKLAKTIIQRQINISEKVKRSDFTIDNSKDFDHLKKEVDQFLSKIIS